MKYEYVMGSIADNKISLKNTLKKFFNLLFKETFFSMIHNGTKLHGDKLELGCSCRYST